MQATFEKTTNGTWDTYTSRTASANAVIPEPLRPQTQHQITNARNRMDYLKALDTWYQQVESLTTHSKTLLQQLKKPFLPPTVRETHRNNYNAIQKILSKLANQQPQEIAFTTPA